MNSSSISLLKNPNAFNTCGNTVHAVPWGFPLILGPGKFPLIFDLVPCHFFTFLRFLYLQYDNVCILMDKNMWKSEKRNCEEVKRFNHVRYFNSAWTTPKWKLKHYKLRDKLILYNLGQFQFNLGHFLQLKCSQRIYIFMKKIRSTTF